MSSGGRLDPGALAYETVAERYESGRPGYQPHLVERVRELFIEGGAEVVVDLAAGTGKFTRALATADALVIAIEPVSAMARQLMSVVDGVQAVRGLAGGIPLADGSVGSISVAQAFQWFDQGDVVEIARVLCPEGVLALVRNNRQDTGDWQVLSDVLDPYRTSSARRVDAIGWLEESGDFSDVTVEKWHWTRTLTRAQLHDHIASLSWIALLGSDDSDRLHQRIDDLFGSRERHRLDYVSELVWARRL
ncbi:MAG: class I SAM-dependent methyltransferase [Acidimicrobiales bacterium]